MAAIPRPQPQDHSLPPRRWCCRQAILYRQDDGAAAIPDSGSEIKNQCSPEAILEFFLASIPKSGLEIKNRCTKDGIFRQNHASIPESGPEIKNQCTKDGISRQNHASIPKSGPKIKNRCTKDGISRQNHASIPKSGPEITNQCSRGIAAVCRRNHSSLQKRKIESDAKYAAATAAAGRTILRSRRRKLESDAENRCLNGRAYGSNFIRHSELCKGARLEFTMSDQANY